MKKPLIALLCSLAASAAAADGEFANEGALIDSWLSAQRAYENVPGLSVAVVRDQELLWSGGFGLADIGLDHRRLVLGIQRVILVNAVLTTVVVMPVA